MAAALKEVEGYPTIGEKTFGKGTVQEQVDLGDKSHIKLTMYKWLTPDGNWIHKKGIEPVISVAQSDLFRLHPLQLQEPLRADMNNEQVKNVQFILKTLGFEPGRYDGYYDETTEMHEGFRTTKQFTCHRTGGRKTAQKMDEKVKREMEKTEMTGNCKSL